VNSCKNLRPVQIKELTEELQKIQKLPNSVQTILDLNDAQEEQVVKEANQPKRDKS